MLKETFKLNLKRRIVKERIPTTDEFLIIVEDVFADPEKVVWLAEQLEYSGFRSNAQFKRYIGERARVSIYQDELMAEVYSCVDTKLPSSAFQRQDALFTKFNLDNIAEMDRRQFVPHVDNDSLFSGLVYLSKVTNSEFGGTAFYRHRPTGISKLPFNPLPEIVAKMKERGLSPASKSDYVEFIKQIMYTDLRLMGEFQGFTGIPKSCDVWELLYLTQPKFNTLVVFPAMQFHSPVIDASALAFESRLTQNIFLMVK